MFHRYFLVNIILLVIMGLLAFRFYQVWEKTPDFPAQTSRHQSLFDKKSPDDKRELFFNKAAYQVIVQKDLFRPSRSAPQANEISSSASPKELPKLFGTVIRDNNRSAILEDPFSKISKLFQINETVGGFIISDIQKDRVILLRESESFEVRLRDSKAVTPAVRKPPLLPSDNIRSTIRQTSPPQPPAQRRPVRPGVPQPSHREESLPMYYE